MSSTDLLISSIAAPAHLNLKNVIETSQNKGIGRIFRDAKAAPIRFRSVETAKVQWTLIPLKYTDSGPIGRSAFIQAHTATRLDVFDR